MQQPILDSLLEGLEYNILSHRQESRGSSRVTRSNGPHPWRFLESSFSMCWESIALVILSEPFSAGYCFIVSGCSRGRNHSLSISSHRAPWWQLTRVRITNNGWLREGSGLASLGRFLGRSDRCFRHPGKNRSSSHTVSDFYPTRGTMSGRGLVVFEKANA
jgi:hypothetical protein